MRHLSLERTSSRKRSGWLRCIVFCAVAVSSIQGTARAASHEDSVTAQGHVFNVVDYGATPDDDTPDDEAMQRADAAAGPGFAVIVFPAGRYVRRTPWIPKSNRLYVGPGVIQRAAHTNIRLVDASGLKSVVFDGLTFDGNKGLQPPVTASTAYGIVLSDSSDIAFRRCVVTKFARYSLRFERSSRIVLQENRIDGGEGAQGVPSCALLWTTDSGVVAENVRVLDNEFIRDDQNSYWAVAQFQPYPAGQSGRDVVFSGNHVRMPFRVSAINALPLEVARVDGFVVSNNSVVGGAMGISIAGSSSGTVVGNHVELGAPENYARDKWNHKGIEVTDSQDIALTGNTIAGRGFAGCGIRVNKNNSAISISGNIVRHMNDDACGIELSNSTDSTASSNIVEAGATTRYGLFVGRSSNVVLQGNVIRDSRQGPYPSLFVFESSNVMCAGNLVSHFGDFGIRSSNNSQITVTNNHVEDGAAASVGIFAEGGSKTSVAIIAGNTIASVAVGVRVLRLDRVRISHNTLQSATKAPIRLDVSPGAPLNHVNVRDNLFDNFGSEEPPIRINPLNASSFGDDIDIEYEATAPPRAAPCVPGIRVRNSHPNAQSADPTAIVTGWRCVPGTRRWVSERVSATE